MPDGGCVLAGESGGDVDFDGIPMAGLGGNDGFVARYDATGELQWARLLGGPGDDHSGALSVDASGAIHVTGRFRGTGDFAGIELISAGGDDGYVLAPDGSGAPVWASRFGGDGDEDPTAMAVDPVTGTVLVAGGFVGDIALGDTVHTAAEYNGFVFQFIP